MVSHLYATEKTVERRYVRVYMCFLIRIHHNKDQQSIYCDKSFISPHVEL